MQEFNRVESRGVTACSTLRIRQLCAPLLFDLSDTGNQRSLGSAAARDRIRPPRNPPTVVAESIERQTRGVSRDVGGDRHADGWWYQERQPPCQDPGHEDSADAAITVAKWMDDFKLGVSHGGLCDRVHIVTIHVGNEVVQECREFTRWRRNEVSVERA